MSDHLCAISTHRVQQIDALLAACYAVIESIADDGSVLAGSEALGNLVLAYNPLDEWRRTAAAKVSP